MKILVISDSHDRLIYLESLAKKVDGHFDKCFHLGDVTGNEDRIKRMLKIPIEFVKGNCDLFSNLPNNVVMKVGKHNCLLTHGHLYGAKGGYDGLVEVGKQNNADYVFFGHTHIPVITEIEGVTLANPGSITLPNADRPSYIALDVDEDGEIHLALNFV